MSITKSFLKIQKVFTLMMLIIAVVFLSLVALHLLQRHFQLRVAPPQLPPGPYPWQLLTNLPLFIEKPHVALKNLANIYGPLFSFRIGMRFIVVASSSDIAKEILRNRNVSSGRYLPSIHYHIPESNRSMSIASAVECNSTWKTLRSIGQTYLFSSKAVESNCVVSKRKVMEMVDYIRTKEGQVVNIENIISTTFPNIVSNILVSKDLLADDGNDTKVNDFLDELSTTATSFGLSDIFPILERIDTWSKRKAMRNHQSVVGIWGYIIDQRRVIHGNNLTHPNNDFLKFLLNDNEAYTTNEIAVFLMELLITSTDSITAISVWLMVELLKNEEIITQVCYEIANVVDENNVLDESRLSECQFFNACIRETLRLHPPSPLGVPHRAIEACNVSGFLIPKDSVVMMNLWAIQLDPQIWENSNNFQPERFLNSKADFRGSDFEFIPFSAGQRMCPGINMAIRSVQVLVASLLHYFDWTLPGGVSLTDIDTTEKLGVVLKKKEPLCLIPKVGGK